MKYNIRVYYYFQDARQNSMRPSRQSSSAVAASVGGSAAVSASAAITSGRGAAALISIASDPFRRQSRPRSTILPKRTSIARGPVPARRAPTSRRIGNTRISSIRISPGSRVLSIRPLKPPAPRRQAPTRGPGFSLGSSSGRNPGYLVIPASTLINLLASRSSSGSFPNANLGVLSGHGIGMQPGFGMSYGGVLGAQLPLVLGGQGQSINPAVVPPFSANPLLNALGIAGNGGVVGVAGGIPIVPSGVSFLGSQSRQAANLTAALGGRNTPSANLLSNELPVSRTPAVDLNGAKNIIIQDTGTAAGTQGNGLVISGTDGTITIQGNLFSGKRGGGEVEEFEAEEVTTGSPANAKSGATKQNTGTGSGSSKSQTITIDSSNGGTFTIGDKTPNGMLIPGNATFILNSGTTPKPVTMVRDV